MQNSTASAQGFYLELVSAVVRQLPRDIDSSIADGWINNQKALKKALRRALMPGTVAEREPTRVIGQFAITCRGNSKASELVAFGTYNSVSYDMTDERFPIQTHKLVVRKIELVELDYDLGPDQIKNELRTIGLERPTIEDALQFGIEYPGEQQKHAIVFFHEPVRGNLDHELIIVLDGHGGRRFLGLFSPNNKHNQRRVYAGVRD